ncbi:hypothetical protein ACOMHN_041864 [Nucella lapillus]
MSHSFLACDARSSCWAKRELEFPSDIVTHDIPTSASCSVPGVPTLAPLYACAEGSHRVSYTFVCDHRQDCYDNSDESFCVFAVCQGGKDLQCGSSGQCFSLDQFCDGHVDCVNKEDEVTCASDSLNKVQRQFHPPPPAVIDFTKDRNISVIPLPTGMKGQSPVSPTCPDTHYQCANNGYCLPTFTRCNGYYDCPDHEDEADCDSYTCPSHYRCFDSQVCVHPSQVCDGLEQCPRTDDELLCELDCPQNCTCHGLAFTCLQPFPAWHYPDLRYLLARGSGFIQPVSYNPESDMFSPQTFRHNVSLAAPDGHAIVISFLHMNLACGSHELLTVSTIARGHTRKLWSGCGTLPPLPQVVGDVEAVMLDVKCVGDDPGPSRVSFIESYPSQGFRMLYSFHKESNTPQRLSNNQWNCSTPFSPDFHPHLSCNLIVECDSGQDESTCPHGLCEHGRFLVEGRCYLLGQPSRPLTYMEARSTCEGQGGYLISFNSKAELTAVREAVWPRNRIRDVYVGLSYLSIPSDTNSSQRIPFTLVCDYLADCNDRSDEDFCVYPPCSLDKPIPCGASGQCFHGSNWCDNKDFKCKNAIDDNFCMPTIYMFPETQLVYDRVYRLPSMVNFYTGNTKFTNLEAYEQDSECPLTHVQCPLVPYRLPVFLRCNGVFDCPHREDEDDCQSYVCPGYFRCRQSQMCLHPDHVCDGKNHCPQFDDEWYCSLTCPHSCSCQGLAFTCVEEFPVGEYPNIRFLDASGSQLKPEILFANRMLVYLSLQNCSLTQLLLPDLPNLKILDLKNNQLEAVSLDTLRNVSNLHHLMLSSNPLRSLFPSWSHVSLTVPKLRILDLAFTSMQILDLSRLPPFSGLRSLNLYGSRIHSAIGDRLQLPNLNKMDLRGCEMSEFPRDFLKNLNELRELYADNFKLCCDQSLPDNINSKDCHASPSVFCTCEHLLGADAQRITIYLLITMTLIGNGFLLVFILRESTERNSVKVFVCHLCISKFLMGLYLCVLSVADQVYRDQFLWEDRAWWSGILCKVSAFLFFLSSQVSVLVDVSVTLERCTALIWQAGRLGETQRRKMITSTLCLLAWLTSACLAIFPTAVPPPSGNDISQTSLCVPLPVPKNRPGGHDYAFSILVVFNTTLMLSSLVGQAYIYVLTSNNTLALLVNGDKARELTSARRVISLVNTDACCWGLVTLWSILTILEMWDPGDVRSSLSVFFIFASAALTPYLFVAAGVIEGQREVQKQRVLKRLGFQSRCTT